MIVAPLWGMKLQQLIFVSSLLISGASIAAADTATESHSTVIRETPDSTLNDQQSTSRTEIERIHTSTPAGSQAAGTAPQGQDSIDRTVISRKEMLPSAFRDEAVGIKPQVGFVTRSDGVESNGHAVAGLMLDFNVLGKEPARPAGKAYLAPSLGIFYSHIGNAGSDFLGLNGREGDEGTHLLMLPFDVKAGYTFNDSVRLAAHLGVNALYENRATTENTTAGPTRVRGSNWSGVPNLGADLEFGVGRNVGLLLRPDWTFASGDTFFTGTVGLDLPIS